ncbi:S-type pyocin domain-containing protein [Pseudomonas sp. B26(2017)]|uniref:S-type pyocin domain-containing protein n=1 Tax=Pseudomonas sp. B26(2017) TaxID=1981732 RepID=UPI0021159BD9|nr:S-type pyocin domain-containing protein [Pseudomonas sp. B26(2017)]
MSSGTGTVPPGTLSLGIREIETVHQVALSPANTGTPSSGVRVRPAAWSVNTQTYSFTAEGVAPLTVSWVPSVADENSPKRTAFAYHRLEFLRSAAVPLLETFTESSTVVFDDYVVVFPAESGLDPVYVMFRNPLEFAQAASTTPAPVAPPETR